MAIEKLRKSLYLCRAKAVIAQLVELQLPKLQVAGSNPVYRSNKGEFMAKVKLKCPNCEHEWDYSYFQWILKAPFHLFSFSKWKDFRKTKCPKCGKKSWISR